MRTLEYLFGPSGHLFWPAVLVAGIVAALCSVLSPLVVLKRLAFIGQGVSHAAFGGVGLALVLGLGTGGAGDPRLLGVVTATCIGAALGIAWLSRRRAESSDTAIGIVLVTSMAIGFVLMQIAATARGGLSPSLTVESVLFGSIIRVGWGDVWLAAGVGVAVVFALWFSRDRTLFWAFDPVGADAFGVRTARYRTALLVLLAITIVVTMRLAGVVLTTALLVLPGATSLRLSVRLGPVWLMSVAFGLAGVALGLVVSFEFDWPAGPSIVLVQAMLYTVIRMLPVRRGA